MIFSCLAPGRCRAGSKFAFKKNDQEIFDFRIAIYPHLGPFEQQVLEKLWSCGNATVREVLDDGKLHQAYTTVMTTMDRLYKKGLLDRVAEGRAFRYTPRFSSEEIQRGAALDGIRQLLN